MRHKKTSGKPPQIKLEKGTLYYSKTLERRIFFFMTLAMLVAGLAARLL